MSSHASHVAIASSSTAHSHSRDHRCSLTDSEKELVDELSQSSGRLVSVGSSSHAPAAADSHYNLRFSLSEPFWKILMCCNCFRGMYCLLLLSQSHLFASLLTRTLVHVACVRYLCVRCHVRVPVMFLRTPCRQRQSTGVRTRAQEAIRAGRGARAATLF